MVMIHEMSVIEINVVLVPLKLSLINMNHVSVGSVYIYLQCIC
jgi:hypothetical protein